MISTLSIFLLPLCLGKTETPYEHLLPQTSVWSQSIDTRLMDTTRVTECRENLGVFPVGNGDCFTYLGIGVPQNTLFMMTGPRYQTDGNHNPLGGFGELSMNLREGGATVDLPLQSCRAVRGAPVVLTSEQGEQWRLTTVTAAPPGGTAILRWITVECFEGPSRDVALTLEFRGRAMQHDEQHVRICRGSRGHGASGSHHGTRRGLCAF